MLVTKKMMTNNLHKCSICGIYCTGPESLKQHFAGKKHKKNEAKLAASRTLTNSKQELKVSTELEVGFLDSMVELYSQPDELEDYFDKVESQESLTSLTGVRPPTFDLELEEFEETLPGLTRDYLDGLRQIYLTEIQNLKTAHDRVAKQLCSENRELRRQNRILKEQLRIELYGEDYKEVASRLKKGGCWKRHFIQMTKKMYQFFPFSLFTKT